MSGSNRPIADPVAGDVSAAPKPVLWAKGLTKSYGPVVALRGADLELYPSEVLGLIGDNGAGKSTLVKCLAGAESPDSGEIRIDGERVVFRSPLDARRAGIETVHQTLGVVPALDIASNLFLGRELRRPGLLGTVFRMLDVGRMERGARADVERLGIETLQDTRQSVETLSGGQRQAVAVARAVAFGSKVLIMDEPTAALGVRESGQVLRMVRTLRDGGVPVILISHNMPNVWELADRVQIMRLGRRIAVITPQSHTMEEGVALMTGAREAAA
ncbi:MAG: ATP-binding cassette domain-containing protein [Acetobacteraceae bacterium]